ncbi:DUF1444 domain-containing protein [Fictibacillus sp. Mic-4]|uniref:DUF1444 domain-containing protein n=1 Tax=Fictibacillus TaxID=1329200 RepID=UPI00041D4235|nr:DUF1444 domain-containing protein [Fictibacillus gelatini]
MSSPIQLKKALEERLCRPEWTITYDRESEKLRVENKETKTGITLSLSGLVVKWERQKDRFIDEMVYTVEEALNASKQQMTNVSRKNIYPVIRSTSFPTETTEGKVLLYEDHTAETRIFFALDLGKSYRLLTKEMADQEGLTLKQLKEMALFNIRSLENEMKEDVVAGNTFYFINYNDGYDASRIINSSLLEKMEQKVSGTLAVSIPHQDVLIFADIQNDQGYDILGQMAMQFFMNGRVPITALPFIYEKGELEPIFILAKNRPVDEMEGDRK